MRIAVVAEEFSSRADEGALNFLSHVLHRLDETQEMRAYHARGEAPAGIDSRRVRIPRFFLGRALRRDVEGFAPASLVYIPSAAATISALWRFRRMERAFSHATTVMVSTQHREYGPLARSLLRWVRPSRLLVMSRRSADHYAGLGIAAEVVPMGVDLGRFRPLAKTERDALRVSMGWSPQQRVVLHVGHLRTSRGLERLVEAARQPRQHVVMVASTSFPADEVEEQRLTRAGVEIRREYHPQVERFYQAADVYLFPVAVRSAAIELPLSVLEALACDMPVVTTPFGGLPERFAEGQGLVYLREGDPVLPAIERVLTQPRGSRAQADRLSWNAAVDHLAELCVGAAETGTPPGSGPGRNVA